MTTITIYSPSGTAVHEAPIANDAKVFRQLGGDYYIELSFNVASVLALPKGSYIQIADPTTSIVSKYALKKDASPEPISGVDGYKYVLKFYAGQHDMEACQIKWLAGGSKELSFRLTTSLRGYAKLIADNMNAYLESDIWAYDESLDDKDMQEQSFEGVSCWEAINNIANAFGVEWWVSHGEKLTIHFGKCENKGDAIDIREGEIVNRFPAPKRGDDSNYGTRFYIFGGSQNVPDDYRKDNSTTGGTTFHISEKRICLREFALSGQGVAMDYIPYYDAVTGLSTAEIVEKTIILDDVFPKNETTIGAGDILEQKENIIDGQDPQSVYYIKVDNKPTLLSTLGITFTSGALAGRSFGADIVEKNNTYQIKIIHTTENSGGSSVIAVPNANLRPEVDDKYILTGVKLDDSSIEYAERELWDKGTELARQRANDTNVYDCPTNPVYCQAKSINFDLGDKVVLKGAHFGEDGRKSRVQGYEKLLYAPYVATYNIGDNSVYSRTLKAYKELNATIIAAVGTTTSKGGATVKGEKGDPGNYTETRYTKATSSGWKPTVDDKAARKPTSKNSYPEFIWSLEIPNVGDGEYLWKIEAAINGSDDTLLSNWSDPIRVTPVNGNYMKYMYALSTDADKQPDFYSRGTTPGDNWKEYFYEVVNKGGYIWQTAMKINGNTGNNMWTDWSDPIRITPEDGRNGLSVSEVTVEYAVSDSPLNAPTEWIKTTPQWENGKFIWSRTIPKFSDSTSGTASAPVCLTGSKGATGNDGISISWQGELTAVPNSPKEGWAYYNKNEKKSFIWHNGKWGVMTQDGTPGDAGISITNVDVEYASSTSNTTAPTDDREWSTTAPDWKDGEYIWSRTKTTYSEGDPTYSTAVCITGGKGASGDDGRGIVSIVELYYSSTSATKLLGGEWNPTYPGWVDGMYIWTKSIITYTDGTTEETTPICVTGGKGETGDKGSRGPALRGPQDWNDIGVGYKFYSGKNNDPFIDVVLYNGDYYLCKAPHYKVISPTYTPSDSSDYWTKSEKFDIIATKLLLSDYALIKKLGAGFIYMEDDSGDVVFSAEGGKVVCNSGTFNNITVGSGTIGGWNISDKGLTNKADYAGLPPNIRCISKDAKAEASIGPNATGTSPSHVAYFKNDIYDGYDTPTYGVGIQTRSSNPKNIALHINGGCIHGLAMSNVVVTDNSYKVERGINHVILTSNDNKAIVLPKLFYEDDGYVVRIICPMSGNVKISTTASHITPNKDDDTVEQAIVYNTNGLYTTKTDGSITVVGGLVSMEFVWVRDYPVNKSQSGAWVQYMHSKGYSTFIP